MLIQDSDLHFMGSLDLWRPCGLCLGDGCCLGQLWRGRGRGDGGAAQVHNVAREHLAHGITAGAILQEALCWQAALHWEPAVRLRLLRTARFGDGHDLSETHVRVALQLLRDAVDETAAVRARRAEVLEAAGQSTAAGQLLQRAAEAPEASAEASISARIRSMS